MEYWIETYTGKIFDFEDIESNEIDIKDIAHALSQTCRFNGHSSRFYSVAEHSFVVALSMSNRKLILPALLHDATEAYMPDISKPLKSYWNTRFKLEDFEQRISDHIFKQLLGIKLTDKEWKEIKQYDYAALKAEANIFFKNRHLWNLPENLPKITEKIMGVNPNIAEAKFLTIYEILKIN